MPNRSDARLDGLMRDIRIGKDVAQILDAPAVNAWFNATIEGLLDLQGETSPGPDGHDDRQGIAAQIQAIRGLRKSLTDARARGKRAESQMNASTPDG